MPCRPRRSRHLRPVNRLLPAAGTFARFDCVGTLDRLVASMESRPYRAAVAGCPELPQVCNSGVAPLRESSFQNMTRASLNRSSTRSSRDNFRRSFRFSGAFDSRTTRSLRSCFCAARMSATCSSSSPSSRKSCARTLSSNWLYCRVSGCDLASDWVRPPDAAWVDSVLIRSIKTLQADSAGLCPGGVASLPPYRRKITL